MLETIIPVITSLINAGVKLYMSRNDPHEAIVKQFADLQAAANALEASLKAARDARDHASLAALDALEAKK